MQRELTATHRVPYKDLKDPNWVIKRAEIINDLIAHLWSSGWKVVGDVTIEEETIKAHDGEALWLEFRAMCEARDHVH